MIVPPLSPLLLATTSPLFPTSLLHSSSLHIGLPLSSSIEESMSSPQLNPLVYITGSIAVCATVTAFQYMRHIEKLEKEVLMLKKKRLGTVEDSEKKSCGNSDLLDTSNELLHDHSISTIPVGEIESVYRLCVGTPRQGMLAPNSRGRIRLDPKRIRPDSLDGLEQYSHIYVVFEFHLNTNTKVVKKAAAKNNNTFPSKVSPPALGGKRVGIFATRTPHRPNPVGFSLCKIDGIDQKNFCVHVSGLDLVDGTPVVDIKPYVPHYDSVGFDVLNFSEDLKVPGWVADGLDRRRETEILPSAEEELKELVYNGKLDFYGGKRNKHESSTEAFHAVKSCIKEVLASDVRSSYQTKKARKGRSQAERALKKKSTHPIKEGTESTIEKPKMCTQQLDNLLIHFSVIESDRMEYTPGINSGCDDRVLIHKIEEFSQK